MIAVREVLRAEGFAALPRRLDEERPQQTRATIEAVADVYRERGDAAFCVGGQAVAGWPGQHAQSLGQNNG